MSQNVLRSGLWTVRNDKLGCILGDKKLSITSTKKKNASVLRETIVKEGALFGV